MKLWLDDIRKAPDGWQWVKTAQEAIACLSTGKVKMVSLDHDLGNDELYGTGYTVLTWVERQVFENESFPIPEMLVHSANAVGRVNMFRAIRAIEKMRTK